MKVTTKQSASDTLAALTGLVLNEVIVEKWRIHLTRQPKN